MKSSLLCGDSGSRTRVQTRNQYAFYMLVSACVFVPEQDRSYQFRPYLLCFRLCRAADTDYLRYFHTAVPFKPRSEGLERCPVSAPCAEIRPIYYTSIRQREHNHCCRLIRYRPSLTSFIYSARHAYIPALPAVKTNYPLQNPLQRYKLRPVCQNLCTILYSKSILYCSNSITPYI